MLSLIQRSLNTYCDGPEDKHFRLRKPCGLPFSSVVLRCCVNFRCMYSKVSQLYMCVHLFSFRFFSHTGYCRLLTRASCAAERALVDRFVYSGVYVLTPVSSFTPHLSVLVAGSLFSHLRVCVCFGVSSFALPRGFGTAAPLCPLPRVVRAALDACGVSISDCVPV